MQEQTFRVGEWLVLAADNKITREGRVLVLEPRLIDMLSYFAHHPDTVLSRDELIDNVWKRNIVTNHVVTQCISELRKYLKDGRTEAPEYIVTVPKRGYKLVEPVLWCNGESSELALASATSLESSSAPLSGRVEASPTAEAPPQTSAPPVSPRTPVEMPVAQAAAPASPLSERAAESEVAPLTRIPRYKRSSFWVWVAFLTALLLCVSFVGLAVFSNRVPVAPQPMLLNPRDIDIRIQGGNSCSNWTNQLSYVVGLSEELTQGLNTYSTFLVHDQTNYNYGGPSSSGKSLYIEFVNQRHYRAQQCFLSVRLVDNADNSVMLEKRYFITPDNLLSVQKDFVDSIFSVLKVKMPPSLALRYDTLVPTHSQMLQQYYQAHQLLLQGDGESLNQANRLLAQLIKQDPDFVYAKAEKALVDILLNSYQPLSAPQLTALRQEINEVEQNKLLQGTPIIQQIYTVDYLGQGKVEQAFAAINKGIELEMSWLNYVLLGKVYELKGQNNQAADAYITAFNLRPGNNTLYWIKNGVFQTNIERVAPYLLNYDAEKIE
ncbi:lysine decarboxylation/transport transcriptional activator CadC [Edwardsiella tarda]|uniref:Transcriptional regulatory protein, C-terminal domain protein n=3 Tax=Edwardsiella tarda TaxID=636 RepID=D4F2I1_EDWTA|nr:lysine decarboxylation/transport transcriptional activator CadC [Edwardsiella tarda]ATI63510.1 transcriptional regulator CadC [Edwardsiella tarda]EFE24008.1 transcriptional regulatory protein, C-terminal domain protein [Edwardsiella tarda ATCC 23685]UAL57407.1 lysine decarboxylation/transport transcriptional activator CadC [Edwardsiella tarda]UCP99537.1 lysine decarboxylation/transport transcriptional activator CadC [Edwardsiella tarda ATCC 15947 = NBRC 105688]UCQ17203.1 lysine decarboxylat